MTPQAMRLRKRDLTIRLQKVNPHPEPKIALEQYTIPADLAAEILFIACYVYHDIENRCVVDLGTGTGRLALGASMLGADYVVGVDLDRASLGVASRFSKLLGLQTDLVLGDIETLRGPIDTVLMNPPFGTKQRHADVQFLKVALRLGTAVYTIHKSSTREFLAGWLRHFKVKVECLMSAKMEIPHQFSFHRKKRIEVEVDVFRIEVG